ncbi:MAG: VWA domain-containing protein [Acidobacteriota bacterium]
MQHLSSHRSARVPSAAIITVIVLMTVFGRMSAQNDTFPTPTQTLQITTQLVVLDVRVVDSSRHFVSGLDRSQFGVYEDGTPQTILDFEAPSSPASARADIASEVHSTADLLRQDVPSVNVLVVDELNTPLSEISRARNALVEYLLHQPPILPVPTLFVASGASRLTVLRDFTQDRDSLLAVLKAHVSDVDFRALSDQLAGGNTSPSEGFAKTLGALSQLASSLRGIHSHKNVIWVGSGFDKAFDLTSAGSNDSEAIESATRTVTTRMLDARISLSTLDPAGMDAQDRQENIDAEATNGGGGNALTNFAQGISFDELAQTTGGSVVHGRNDLFTLVMQTSGAANEFYTIAYRPAALSDASPDFLKIHVLMKNASLKAITRTGYLSTRGNANPTSAEATRQTRQYRFDLLSAASSRLDYTGLQVAAQKNGRDRFLVAVGANDLTWAPAGDHRTADISLMAVAFDAKDNIVSQSASTFHEQIKETDRTFGTHVTLTVALNTPRAAKRVRFVVRDAGTGNVGSFELAP